MAYSVPFSEAGSCIQKFLDMLVEVARDQNNYTFFCSIVELWAIALRRVLDKDNREALDARYREITEMYRRAQRRGMMLLTELLMTGRLQCSTENRPMDILGPVYAAVDWHANKVGTVYTQVPPCESSHEHCISIPHVCISTYIESMTAQIKRPEQRCSSP